MLKLCLLIFLLRISILLADSIDDEDQHLKEVVISFIENKCKRNGGDDAFDKLKNSFDDFRSCINHEIIAFGLTKEDEALQKLCSKTQRDSIRFCMNLTVNQLKPCLDEQENYLPHFIFGWFNSTSEEHCKDGGKAIIEHIRNAKDLDCKAMDKITTHELAEKCFEISTLIKNFESSNFIITETRLCTYFERGNKCLIDILKERCKPIVSQFIEHHLKPTKTWCDKYLSNVELD